MKATATPTAATLNVLRDEARPRAPLTDAAYEELGDLKVCLALEVGRCQIPIRQFLQLNVGSVVELQRGVDAAFDILINSRLLAHGEVVAVDNRLNVRLTDVISR
jgi:flagellar motor switch protein FliN/FliY